MPPRKPPRPSTRKTLGGTGAGGGGDFEDASASPRAIGSAERGWPIGRLGPRIISLAEGRVGALSIHQTRADVERTLGVRRRDLLGVSPAPAPRVALRIVFESDEDSLYDSEEMMLHAEELAELWGRERGRREPRVDHIVAAGLVSEAENRRAGGTEPTTDEIALAPEDDGIVDLLLDWSNAGDPDAGADEGSIPQVRFPDGRITSGAWLSLDELARGLGAPPRIVEEFDDLRLCEWPREGFLVIATVAESGLIIELGFSQASLGG
jgi:hypothetical protein